MSITIGTLVIDLTASTASFTTEMGKASNLAARSANDIKRSLEKITIAGAAMAAALVTGTAGVIRSALDQVDALGKAAQAAGTTAETLSTLQYAAKLSNVENEQLTKGLEKLSLAAFKAQGGNVQLGNIFKRLGVNIMDANGHLKDSGILLEEMSPKFAAMADGAGKTALAQAIFGKAGAGLIPMLNQYGEDQARVNDEAHRFGLVLSQSTVDVAMKAHDNLDRLSSVMKGMGFSLLSATLPALDQLLQKLIDISQHADLQGLAQAFGSKVTTAVHALGDALDFAATHATALKIALEAIAGLALAKVAIPVIGDLAAGGWEKAAAGLGKFVIGFAGLGRVLPVLTQFGSWLKYTASFVGLLAAEEGIASAASYVLGGAISAMGGPIGIALAAIVGIGIALYKFRDATFSLGGTTYEIRDIWNAAWIVMKDTVSVAVDFFKEQFAEIKSAWTVVVDWIKSNPIGKFIADDFSDANTRLEGYLSRFANFITPTKFRKALDEAKRQREAAAKPASSATQTSAAKGSQKEQPDTSGLGKPQKDPYGNEIDKLNLAIEAQQKYLEVVSATPEVIQAAIAAEKANAIIVEINNKLHDEGRAKLTALQRATIEQKVATEESLKSLVEYGREVVSQQHSADLAIQQTRAMSLVQIEGDEAVRQATVDNAILATTYNKTAEQLARMAPELAKLRDLLTVRSNVDLIAGVNREVFAIGQEIASQRILQDAMLGTIATQRQAEIEAKTYALSQQIAATSDDAARAALIHKRDEMVEQMRLQQQANDLAEARRTLGGPGDEFEVEKEHLRDLVGALSQAQGGYLTYAQEVQAAAAYQDIFDKMIDQTVQSMIRFGGARDGVHAFLLDMQKSAQSTGSIIYEAMHSAFDKISENLTQLVTGGKTSFAKMFEDIGRQIVQSGIKKHLQEAVGALGGKLGINLNGLLGNQQKIDGSSANNALWVRMAAADGSELTSFGQRSTNELTDLIGPNPNQPEQTVSQINQIAKNPPTSASTALSDLPSFIKLLGGLSSDKSPFGESLGLPKGNELTDLLGSTGIGGPKGTATNPLYVKTSGGQLSGGMGGLGDLLGGGTSGGFGGDESEMDFATDEGIGGGGFLSSLGSIFGSLFSKGGSSGGLSSIFSMLGGLIPHAEGGPVSPSSAYLVGEKGPEILTGASGNITSNANSRRMMDSGGPNIYYSIDARGTDPALTEQRTRQAILAAHNSSVNQSLQASAERMKRVPHR